MNAQNSNNGQNNNFMNKMMLSALQNNALQNNGSGSNIGQMNNVLLQMHSIMNNNVNNNNHNNNHKMMNNNNNTNNSQDRNKGLQALIKDLMKSNEQNNDENININNNNQFGLNGIASFMRNHSNQNNSSSTSTSFGSNRSTASSDGSLISGNIPGIVMNGGNMDLNVHNDYLKSSSTTNNNNNANGDAKRNENNKMDLLLAAAGISGILPEKTKDSSSVSEASDNYNNNVKSSRNHSKSSRGKFKRSLKRNRSKMNESADDEDDDDSDYNPPLSQSNKRQKFGPSKETTERILADQASKKCSLCGKPQGKLSNHNWTTHLNSDHKWSCDKCHHKFTKQSYLANHKKDAHEE